MAIDIITYVRAKTTATDEISQLDIQTYVPTPEENDYEVGYITRFFLQKIKTEELTVTSDNIEQYIKLLSNNGILPRSINRKISTLKNF